MVVWNQLTWLPITSIQLFMNYDIWDDTTSLFPIAFKDKKFMIYSQMFLSFRFFWELAAYPHLLLYSWLHPFHLFSNIWWFPPSLKNFLEYCLVPWFSPVTIGDFPIFQLYLVGTLSDFWYDFSFVFSSFGFGILYPYCSSSIKCLQIS